MITLDVAGQRLEAEEGATLGEVFKRSYPEGFKAGVAAKLNGRVIDFHTPVKESGELSFVSVDSPEGLAVLRHSTAHLMASAVMKIFPDVKFAIGPAIEDGFYYDFEVSRPISAEDLAAIEKLMTEIAK
ncbi:MAG TPA: threonine--tRNA ligase, partial [Candidatus Eisenbacteria bacterium]|nr:threonine--tRNA ligase [Candidatus Eisenbacteria bacterium]